jgi:hypothetical protein
VWIPHFSDEVGSRDEGNSVSTKNVGSYVKLVAVARPGFQKDAWGTAAWLVVPRVAVEDVGTCVGANARPTVGPGSELGCKEGPSVWSLAVDLGGLRRRLVRLRFGLDVGSSLSDSEAEGSSLSEYAGSGAEGVSLLTKVGSCVEPVVSTLLCVGLSVDSLSKSGLGKWL